MNVQSVIEYWNRRPCNIRHSIRAIGSKEYFDEVEQRKYFVEPHIPQFAEFERWKDRDVLEIGCGIGTDSINFVRAGARLTVIELSEKSLELTKVRFHVFHLKAKFILGNAENLSDYIKDQKFDLIYSFGVIHHTPHPERIIKEIEKVIKPNGELRLMLYSKYSTKNFMIRLGISQPEAQFGCPVAFTYSKREIQKLLSAFRIEFCQKCHIFPYRIQEYRKYIYKKRFPWNVLPSRLFRLCERWFGWHYLIRCQYQPFTDS